MIKTRFIPVENRRYSTPVKSPMMKSTFLTFWTPLLLSIISGFVHAFLLPGDPIPIDILPEYLILLQLCEDGGSNAVS